MNLSLSKLQSFVAVANARQFRRAAEMLGVSQPTLSAHVRDLEEQLGVALLRRTTRSVMLTTEGEHFLERVQDVLGGLEDALSEIRDSAQLERGRLTIAATPSAAATLLPHPIAAFHSRYPKIRVHVTEDQSSRVLRRVETGEADFGVGPLPEGRGEFAFTILCRDRFVAVVPKDHPLAKRSRLRIEQLVEYPLLTTAPESSIRARLAATLEARGTPFRTDHSLVQHQTVVAMVAAGLGVAFLPSLALGQLDRSGVAFLKVAPDVTREIAVIQRKGGSISSATRGFLELWRSSRNSVDVVDATSEGHQADRFDGDSREPQE
jgi:DNA-binding transcriptional LysR family regulator